jgi:hypothetical protein
LLTYRKEAEEIGNIQPFGKFKKDVLGKFGDAQRHGAKTQDAVGVSNHFEMFIMIKS